MKDKSYDVVALGACYVDTNLENFPFDEGGILPESELVGNHYEVTLGGSAVNFCVLLQSLGLRTTFVGMTGTDPNGALVAELMQRHGIQPALVQQKNVLTNISFNMTSPEGRHIMLVGGSASAALQPDTIRPKLEATIPTAHMLYLGGYFKLKALAPALAQIVDYATTHDTAVVIDHGRIPTGTPEAMLETLRQLVPRATYYFPSHSEFRQLWGVDSIADGLRALQQRAPQLTTIVKDGKNGAFYLDGLGVQHVLPPSVEKVLNATGAGDSFNAGVMAALNKGIALSKAVAYGCQVASAKISGQAMPTLQ